MRKRGVWIAAAMLGGCSSSPPGGPVMDLSACRTIVDASGRPLLGGEDAALLTDGLIVSFDDRRGRGRGSLRLVREDAGGKLLVSDDLTGGRPGAFHPHGIGVWSVGGRAQVMVVNHDQGWEGAKSSVEIYAMRADGSLDHVRSVSSAAFARLNDVTPVSPERFYATNETRAGRDDRLRGVIDYVLKTGDGSLVYFDGKAMREVAGGFAFANSVERVGDTMIAVSDSIRGEIRWFAARPAGGSVPELRTMKAGAGPDNLVATTGGDLLGARHDDLRRFSAYAKTGAGPSQWSLFHLGRADGQADFQLKDVARSNGVTLPAVAVAARLPGGGLFLGGVFDPAIWCPFGAKGVPG